MGALDTVSEYQAAATRAQEAQHWAGAISLCRQMVKSQSKRDFGLDGAKTTHDVWESRATAKPLDDWQQVHHQRGAISEMPSERSALKR